MTSGAIVEPGLPIPCLALPPAATDGPARIENRFDLLPPMRHLRSEHDLSRRIIDDRQACRLGTRIELDAQRLHVRLRHRTFQNQRERIAPIDGGLSRCEQGACSAGMHRGKWLFVRV